MFQIRIELWCPSLVDYHWLVTEYLNYRITSRNKNLAWLLTLSGCSEEVNSRKWWFLGGKKWSLFSCCSEAIAAPSEGPSVHTYTWCWSRFCQRCHLCTHLPIFAYPTSPPIPYHTYHSAERKQKFHHFLVRSEINEQFLCSWIINNSDVIENKEEVEVQSLWPSLHLRSQTFCVTTFLHANL